MAPSVDAPMAAFLELPDEVLQHILSFTSWKALVACQLSCKRLYTLAEYPLLWKHHYLTEYRTWHPDVHHALRDTDAQDAHLSWKQLLASRKLLDRRIYSDFDNHVLKSQTRRYHYIQQISDADYEAKEALLKLADAAPVDRGDNLARRYWALEAMGPIERSHAIREWEKLANGEDVPLERALGAYDLFAAERPPETLDQISEHFDMLAQEYKKGTVDWEELSPRQRSTTLARWLCDRDYTGIGSKAYESLQNNFISIALCEAEHPSLPLISVAIFCCIAQRLGLNAKPCGFPFHVLAVIEAPSDSTLDGKPKASPSTATTLTSLRELMYLDPFTNDQEIPVSRLRTQLTGYGVTNATQQNDYLGATSTIDLVVRVARNITRPEDHPVRTLEGPYCSVLENASPDTLCFHGLSPSTDSGALHTTVDRHRARYAAHWAAVIFTARSGGRGNIAAPLNELLSLALRFRADLHLIKRYIIPLLTSTAGGQAPNNLAAQLTSILTKEIDEDNLSPAPKPRTPGTDAATKVKYHIGHVFRHRRYNYTAVITGWDTACEMSEGWIRQMGVDRLCGGREQCFYHVLVEDESTRYVAEENIVCLSDIPITGHGDIVGGEDGEPFESFVGRDMPEGLARVAGRWFKRWDRDTGAFVSNVEEEYPDG